MFHRTTLERVTRTADTGGGYTDAWSNTVVDSPCRAWFSDTVEQVVGNRPTVLDRRAVLVPLGIDVREGDRLQSVRNRKGTVLFDGPLVVDSVAERTDHLQLLTRKIS